MNCLPLFAIAIVSLFELAYLDRRDRAIAAGAMMSLKKLIPVLVVLCTLSAAQAAEKVFSCTVRSFNFAQKSDFGMGYGAWKQPATVEFRAPVKDGFVKYAETTQTMKIVGPYEVVFDLRWEAETVNDDDVTTSLVPKLTLVARAQERLADGKTRILDMAEAVSRAGSKAAITKRIFAEVQLTNLNAISEKLSDPNVSNSNISQSLEGVDTEAYFSFSCDTDL